MKRFLWILPLLLLFCATPAHANWGTPTPACGSASGTTPTFQTTSAPPSQVNTCSPNIPSGALVVALTVGQSALGATPFSDSNGDTFTACPGNYGAAGNSVGLWVTQAGAALTSVTSNYTGTGFRATTEIFYVTGPASSFVDACSVSTTNDFNSPISSASTGTLAFNDLIISAATEPNNGATTENPTVNSATSGTCISLFTDSNSGWNASNVCAYVNVGTTSQVVSWTISGGQVTYVSIGAVKVGTPPPITFIPQVGGFLVGP